MASQYSESEIKAAIDEYNNAYNSCVSQFQNVNNLFSDSSVIQSLKNLRENWNNNGNSQKIADGIGATISPLDENNAAGNVAAVQKMFDSSYKTESYNLKFIRYIEND